MEITKPIRLIELFGGIGSQAMALRDIGANFEHYKLIEFDKYAVASYNVIHDTRHTTHDIRDIHGQDLEITETDKYCYLMTYSFPCTDLSVAGKMAGMSKAEWAEGKATRSGLLWEVERILKELPKDQLPQVLLMENVPQVHAEKNEADFNSWLDFLNSKGYINFYDDLNAKDYGIPQNRDRCFCVSFLTDEFMEYNFPDKVKLEQVMKDYLEEKVDEKYYLKTQRAKDLIEKLVDDGVIGGLQEHQTQRSDGVCPSLTAAMGMGGGQIPIIKTQKEGVDLSTRTTGLKTICATICARYDAGIINHQNLNTGVIEKTICRQVGRNPDNSKSRKAGIHTEQRLEPTAEGICGALTTVKKDNLVLEKKNIIYDDYNSNIPDDQECIGTITPTCGSPTMRNGKKIIEETQSIEIKQATKEGSIKCKVGGCYDASYPDSKTRRGRVQEGGDVTPTLTASNSENIHYVETQYRIRKLTPKECWRLMGYTDEDYEKAAAVNSNTQLYKQAGNAIVKQVLMAIFRQMIPQNCRQK